MKRKVLATLLIGSVLGTGVATVSASTLSTEDIEALKEARLSGDNETALAILERNGIDRLSPGMRGEKKGLRAQGLGLRSGEMERPDLSELSDEDKEALKAAHESFDREAAGAILEKYGIEMPELPEGAPDLSVLSDEDKAALRIAREAKDHEAAEAILEKYDIEMPERYEHRGKFKANLEALSEEDKEALKEAHEAGDHDEVDAILDKYGIEKPEMHNRGEGRFIPKERFEALRDAVNNGDMDAARSIFAELDQ